MILAAVTLLRINSKLEFTLSLTQPNPPLLCPNCPAAPGQSTLDYVVNEEQLLTSTAFPAGSTVFDIPPETPTCIDAGSATSFAHARKLVTAAGASHAVLSAMPEVRLGFALQQLQAQTSQ